MIDEYLRSQFENPTMMNLSDSLLSPLIFGIVFNKTLDIDRFIYIKHIYGSRVSDYLLRCLDACKIGIDPLSIKMDKKRNERGIIKELRSLGDLSDPMHRISPMRKDPIYINKYSNHVFILQDKFNILEKNTDSFFRDFINKRFSVSTLEEGDNPNILQDVYLSHCHINNLMNVKSYIKNHDLDFDSGRPKFIFLYE